MLFKFKSSFGPRISYEPSIYLEHGRLIIGRGDYSVWIWLTDSDGVKHEVNVCPSYEEGVYLGGATWDDIYRELDRDIDRNREVIRAEHIALWGDSYPFAD
jgi:hypothetical protein